MTDEEDMSMEYVRKTYGVPAKRGRLVEVYYRFQGTWRLALRGRITSASNYIHLDGVPVHPTGNVVYLADDNSVILDTRKDQQ